MTARCSSVLVAVVVGIMLALSVASEARAGMRRRTNLDTLTGTAARIFRGRCVAAETAIVAMAGARLPVTTYTFRVSDHLKGARSRTVTFRQVGAPGGGARDLGRLVGLPTYAPGADYVLFLLPESRIGLTSPAGAGEGAFIVDGERVHAVTLDTPAPAPGAGAGGAAAPRAAASGAATLSDDQTTIPYESFRRAVRERVHR